MRLQLTRHSLSREDLVTGQPADATGAAADGALRGVRDRAAVRAYAACVTVVVGVVLELLGREEVQICECA